LNPLPERTANPEGSGNRSGKSDVNPDVRARLYLVKQDTAELTKYETDKLFPGVKEAAHENSVVQDIANNIIKAHTSVLSAGISKLNDFNNASAMLLIILLPELYSEVAGWLQLAALAEPPAEAGRSTQTTVRLSTRKETNITTPKATTESAHMVS
jgi:hypothetical protein